MNKIKADKAEVAWDAHRKAWEIRIQRGEEVIKRHAPNSVGAETDEATLHSTAVQTAHDEGYEIDAANVTITR